MQSINESILRIGLNGSVLLHEVGIVEIGAELGVGTDVVDEIRSKELIDHLLRRRLRHRVLLGTRHSAVLASSLSIGLAGDEGRIVREELQT